MIRKFRNRKFENKASENLYDSSMLEDILDSIISLSKEVVKKYGEKVADYIGFQHGFGLEGSGYTTAEPLFKWNISCLELSKFNSLKDIDISSVEEGWSKAIENHIEYMVKYSEDDEEDLENLVLTMWLRFQDMVHPLNEMTLEYAFPVEFYSFDDYYCLEPELIDGDEDILTTSLEESELNDIAEGVKDYLDSKDDMDESVHLRIQKRKQIKNEAYSSFTRWRNDIANSFHRWDWNVAKRGKYFPEPVWVDDLYTTTRDYIISVSLAPDGDTVSFNIFKGNDFPYDRPVHIKCSKSDLHNKVDEIKGKVPDDIYKEIKSIFSAYRFK